MGQMRIIGASQQTDQRSHSIVVFLHLFGLLVWQNQEQLAIIVGIFI